MLKIVADDLGLYESVNRGIVLGLREGFITEASLMANGEAFFDAVEKVKDFKDWIGIHLVLVEEKSVLSGIGLTKDYRRFFLKYCLGLIDIGDVEKELEAQISKIEATGLKPTFINSHQHLHLLPGIIDVTINVAKRHSISYIRVVNEPSERAGWYRKTQLMWLEFFSKAARKKILRAGLKCNDIFIGFLNAGRLEQEDINLARRLTEEGKTVELGCHPGFEDEVLRVKYKHWGGYNWEKELDNLKTPS